MSVLNFHLKNRLNVQGHFYAVTQYMEVYVSTIDYNVVIRYLCFSLFRFYIIQIPSSLTLNVVKYFL